MWYEFITTQWFTTSIGSSWPVLGRFFFALVRLSVCVCLSVCRKLCPRPALLILPLLTQCMAGITVLAQGCLMQSDHEFDLKVQGQRPCAWLSEQWVRVSFANFASSDPIVFTQKLYITPRASCCTSFSKMSEIDPRSRS